MLKVLSFFIVVSFLGLGSCSKKVTDPDYCNTAWTTQAQTEITAVSNAAIVYATDPSAANCKSYKAAYQSYINKLEPYGKCSLMSAQQKTAFEDALADAKSDLSTLCQ